MSPDLTSIVCAEERKCPIIRKVCPSPWIPARLLWKKLSDHELSIILSIEHQLEMKRHSVSKPGISKKPYLAPVQVRSPNVLLLDGARGTGKTSLLLTMAHRWNLHSNCDVERHDDDVDKYRKRIGRIQNLQFQTSNDHSSPNSSTPNS